MRPYLTIALLLIASIGAQAADPDLSGGGPSSTGLLSALMDRPAGFLAASQLAVPPPGKLVLGRFGHSAPDLGPSRPLIVASPLSTAGAVPGAVPVLNSLLVTSRIIRGP